MQSTQETSQSYLLEQLSPRRQEITSGDEDMEKRGHLALLIGM